MKIKSPLEINDWKFSSLIYLVLSIQMAIFGLIFLDEIGLHLLFVRPIIGFFFMTYIPGAITLRVLKLHKLGTIRTILYSQGLSLSILMFTGFFINITYPFIGIRNPISLGPVIFTISLVIWVLCIACYLIDKDFSNPNYINPSELFNPTVLFLFIIPFLAIFGTYLVNLYHNNVLLMVMIGIIALIILSICFSKSISTNYYSLLIWVSSISLIYHNTLISMYINGFDVVREYYFSRLVVNNHYWDWNLFSDNNSVLSTAIMAPIYSIVCGLDLTWVYKIIYPFLYSFIPVGLYTIYKERTNEHIGCLASYFFISFSAFYYIVPSACKQLVAEIYLLLNIMIILDNKKEMLMQNKVLLIIFSLSMVTSHYGISYLFMFSLFFVIVISSIFKSKIISNVCLKNFSIYGSSIKLNFTIMFTVSVLTWYIYISNSSAFTSLIHIGDYITNTFWTELCSPESSRGMNSFMNTPLSSLGWISKCINWGATFFIFSGIIKLLFFRQTNSKFEKDYIFFSVYWFIICILSITVSGFAAMNPYRLYHISLFFLAPLGIIGGTEILKTLIYKFNQFYNLSNNSSNNPVHSIRLVSLYFAIFFLFNSGFISEQFNDHPMSMSISQESIKNNEKMEYKGQLANIMFEQNVYGARWISQNMNQSIRVYVLKGNGEGANPLVSYGMLSYDTVDMLTNGITEGYIYLSYLNVVEGIGMRYDSKLGTPTYFSMSDILPSLKMKNKIYDNGGCQSLIVSSPHF